VAARRLSAVVVLGGISMLGGLVLLSVWMPAPALHSQRPAGIRLITGCVLMDGQPVAGATVKVKTARGFALSDASGNFKLLHPTSGSRGDIASRVLRITAAKPGSFIAGADWTGDPVYLHLQPVDLTDNPHYRWIAPHPDATKPQQCGNCHQSIFDEWAASSHAVSASNPRFWNVYDGSTANGGDAAGWNLLQQHPGGAGVCYSCHVPSPQPAAKLLRDLRRVRAGDSVHLEGVHCDFCHKVAGAAIEPVGLNHGRFGLQLARPTQPQHPQVFGPLADVDRGEDSYSPLYSKSQYCASCHEGVVFGVHAYSTYSEWQRTSYASQGVECQDCHMAPTGLMTNIAPGNGGLEREPRTLASHSLPGSQPAFMRQHLDLELTVNRSASGNLNAGIRLQPHQTGHMTPTGHPSRHLILHLQAWDAAGNLLPPLSGPVLPALAGEPAGGAEVSNTETNQPLAGQSGELYGRTRLTADGRPAAFWEEATFTSDTRLHPDVPRRAAFVFPAAASRITATLISRRFSYYVARQKGWKNNSRELLKKSWSQ